MNINDHVYIIIADNDDHIAVTVRPATVLRIVTTTEAGEDGNPADTKAYMVRFDGEPTSRAYHPVREDEVVDLRYSYDHGRKVGDAVLAAIDAQRPKPPTVVGPPPAMKPDPVRTDNTPF